LFFDFSVFFVWLGAAAREARVLLQRGTRRSLFPPDMCVGGERCDIIYEERERERWDVRRERDRERERVREREMGWEDV